MSAFACLRACFSSSDGVGDDTSAVVSGGFSAAVVVVGGVESIALLEWESVDELELVFVPELGLAAGVTAGVTAGAIVGAGFAVL